MIGEVPMGEERRHFTREFKRDAVQLVTEKGISISNRGLLELRKTAL